MNRNHKGFTLIELILVISILGILAVAALPKFLDVTTNARTAAVKGVEGAVRAGLQVYYSNNLVNGGAGAYPTTLDAASAAACGTANICFDTVLTNGLTDANWTKASATSYTNSTHTCTYTPATGVFNCT
jgi:MSHA pilin protein MshA